MRVTTAASAALLVLGACASAPLAGAAGGDQTISVQNGQIRCLLSADFEGHGRPATICARTDGGLFQTSPAKLNLAVVQGTGELFYEAGTIDTPPSADMVLGAGQTYNVNGWTVKTEELRTLIWYDKGRHGMSVKPVEVLAIWI